MQLEEIKTYTDIASFSVIIPLLFSFIYFKIMIKYNRWLLVYLIGSIISELIGWIAYTIFHQTYNIHFLYFEVFEHALFLLILSQFSKDNLYRIYLFSFLFVLTALIFDVAFSLSPPYYTNTIMVSRLMLIFCTTYFLLNNKKPLEKFKSTVIYSILFFVLSTFTIYSFIDYFNLNKNYFVLYIIILSISNFIYYSLFTISIIQLKELHLNTNN